VKKYSEVKAKEEVRARTKKNVERTIEKERPTLYEKQQDIMLRA